MRCEAAGKSKPEVEIRLYNINGPDLTKVPDYKVRRLLAVEYISGAIKYALQFRSYIDINKF